jgi:hypothetical protein
VAAVADAGWPMRPPAMRLSGSLNQARQWIEAEPLVLPFRCSGLCLTNAELTGEMATFATIRAAELTVDLAALGAPPRRAVIFWWAACTLE